LATDLVCGAHVADEKPQFFSDYDGHLYSFCSTGCKRKFDDHPDYFIQEEAKRALGLVAEKE
jgi:Cu+-exporting ATPase